MFAPGWMVSFSNFQVNTETIHDADANFKADQILFF